MYGLSKLAASFDARRKKQYWQMLKRMYGGTDEAVNNARVSRDVNFYHSSKPENIETILENGLLPHVSGYGYGAYLGNRGITSGYGSEKVRLKRPSELTGTSLLYPDVSRVKSSNFEFDSPPMKSQLHAIAYGKRQSKRTNPDFVANAPRGQVLVTEKIPKELLDRASD